MVILVVIGPLGTMSIKICHYIKQIDSARHNIHPKNSYLRNSLYPTKSARHLRNWLVFRYPNLLERCKKIIVIIMYAIAKQSESLWK